MKILPKILVIAVWLSIFSGATNPASAVTIASQTQDYSDLLPTWQVIQELGNNLSGTVQSFTFRVSTSASNLNQFDYTAQNTRLFDKNNNNTFIAGCIPAGASLTDSTRGLTFSTANVPAGFEDVTVDFTCRNYDFIPGHRYLIRITNANMPGYGGKIIRFTGSAYGPGGHGISDQFTGGGLRYANGNPWDYSHSSGSCNASSYIWGDSRINPSSGCNIWTNSKDDLYFILTDTSPPPPPKKLPVIFIPGIGGSEFKTSQDIIWSKDDGHGGLYQYAYAGGEKVWVNETKAASLGDDDYFDILRLKSDGQTAEAPLELTGNLTPFGYPDIDSFFTGIGYQKGTDFFVFPYDWRKDIRTTQTSLDSLVEEAKQKSGMSKVNIVAHSMGGLVARNYISNAERASKVSKLIELGVPHLGATKALKSILYGTWINYDFYFLKIGIIPASEIKDLFSNLPTAFKLSPTKEYFDFYDNSNKDLPYPFYDERDIDNSNDSGQLNFTQMKTLLNNFGTNMLTFDLAEQFHDSLKTLFSQINQINGVKIYNIVGSGKPTLAQIKETWWIKWPLNLIPKTDEIFVNGDDTVPLYSASLKNNKLNYSSSTKLYYVEQRHSDLVRNTGPAMQTVKAILFEGDTFPIEVKDNKINLEGQQISIDDGEIDLYDEDGNHTGLKGSGDLEENIANTFYDSIGKSKHVFIKKSAKKTTVKITSSENTTTQVKIRNYTEDKIDKTIFYNNIPLTPNNPIEFQIDPPNTSSSSPNPVLTSGNQTITATSQTLETSTLDQSPPDTTIQVSGSQGSPGNYISPVTITLASEDNSSGVLQIQYSLDNGATAQTYSEPFIITTPGTTTIQVTSTDNAGNEEMPQTLDLIIATPTPTPTFTPTPTPIQSGPTPTPTSTPASSSQSPTSSSDNHSSSSNTGSDTPTPIPSTLTLSIPIPPVVSEVLGAATQNLTSTIKEALTDNPNTLSDSLPQSFPLPIINVQLVFEKMEKTIASFINSLPNLIETTIRNNLFDKSQNLIAKEGTQKNPDLLGKSSFMLINTPFGLSVIPAKILVLFLSVVILNSLLRNKIPK